MIEIYFNKFGMPVFECNHIRIGLCSRCRKKVNKKIKTMLENK